jgi:hypothetical protein
MSYYSDLTPEGQQEVYKKMKLLKNRIDGFQKRGKRKNYKHRKLLKKQTDEDFCKYHWRSIEESKPYSTAEIILRFEYSRPLYVLAYMDLNGNFYTLSVNGWLLEYPSDQLTINQYNSDGAHRLIRKSAYPKITHWKYFDKSFGFNE